MKEGKKEEALNIQNPDLPDLKFHLYFHTWNLSDRYSYLLDLSVCLSIYLLSIYLFIMVSQVMEKWLFIKKWKEHNHDERVLNDILKDLWYHKKIRKECILEERKHNLSKG